MHSSGSSSVRFFLFLAIPTLVAFGVDTLAVKAFGVYIGGMSTMIRDQHEEKRTLAQDYALMKGIWQTDPDAGEGSNRALITFDDRLESGPGIRFRRSFKIYNSYNSKAQIDAGGGGEAELVEKDGKRFIRLDRERARQEKLPTNIPYQFEGDALVLSIEEGPLKGAYVLHANASNEPFLIFSVSLQGVDDSDVKVVVELVSLGANGLFLRVDGKSVGKVAVIDTDNKVRFKFYRADWSHHDGEFRCILQHEMRSSSEGVKALNWKLTCDGKVYATENAAARLLPQATIEKHMIPVKTVFSDKPGGLQSGDLKFLLYPLPVASDGEGRYFEDSITGVRMQEYTLCIDIKIPTSHMLAYIRSTTLANRASILD